MRGEFAGDESPWMKAHENNLHGASGEHSKGAGGAPRVRITSILKALTGAAAIQAFSLSLGPGSKRRRGSVVGLGVAARASRKPARAHVIAAGCFETSKFKWPATTSMHCGP